jgi:hypothetical protein
VTDKGYTNLYSPEVSPPAEVGTIYVGDKDRFIVSLVVGYDTETIREAMGEGFDRAPVEQKAKVAAAAALELTSDEGSSGTYWFVYDRKTKRLFSFEQSEFEEIDIP